MLSSDTDSGDSLFYPPGYIPSPHHNDAIENEARVYLFPAVAPKYTDIEAKLRLLSCCRDLGISTTHDVKYPDIQKAYELKFGIRLDQDETVQLFLHRKTTKALKETVERFLVITEASQNPDNVIKLRLREGMEEYIKDMEEQYDGEEMRELTPNEVYDILYPAPSTYRYSRHQPIHGHGHRVIFPRTQDQSPRDEEEQRGVEIATPPDKEHRQQDFDHEEQQPHNDCNQQQLYEDDDHEGQGTRDITPRTQDKQPRDQEQQHSRRDFAQQFPQEDDDYEGQGVRDATPLSAEQRNVSRPQHGYNQQQPFASFTPRQRQQSYGHHQFHYHHGYDQQEPQQGFGQQQQHQNTHQQVRGHRNQHQQPRYEEQPGVRTITPRTPQQRNASRQRHGFDQEQSHHSGGHQQRQNGFTPRQRQQSFGQQQPPHHGYNQQQPRRLCDVQLEGFNRAPGCGTNNSNSHRSNNGSAANTQQRSYSVHPQQRSGQRQQQPRRSFSQQRRPQQNGNQHFPGFHRGQNVNANNSKIYPVAAPSSQKVKKFDHGVFGTSTSSIDQTCVEPIVAKCSKKDVKKALIAAKHVKLEKHKKMINDTLNAGLQKLEEHKAEFIKEANDLFETKSKKLSNSYQSKLSPDMDRKTKEKLTAKLVEGKKQLEKAREDDIKDICDSYDAAVKELEDGVQEMIPKFEELYFPKK